MDVAPSYGRDTEHRKFYVELTKALCDAVKHDVRYHTKDHNQRTRADRNYLAGMREHNGVKFIVVGEGDDRSARAVFEIPERGLHLWRIFWQISPHRIDRNLVAPAQIIDWLRLRGQKISTLEIEVIEAMDRQFTQSLAEEIAFNESRRKPK